MVLDSRELDTGLVYQNLRDYHGVPPELDYSGLRGFVTSHAPLEVESTSLDQACRSVSHIVTLGDRATLAATSNCPQRPLTALLDNRDRPENRQHLHANRIILIQPPSKLLDVVAAFQPQARRLIAIVPESMRSWYRELLADGEARSWSIDDLPAEEPVQAHRQLARALLARPYDAVILPPGGDVITAAALRTLFVIAARHNLLLYGGVSPEITRGGVFATVSLPEANIVQAIDTVTGMESGTEQGELIELRANQIVVNRNLYRLRFSARPLPSLPGLKPWPP